MRNEVGGFSWPELLTPDPDGAAGFYAAVFGWRDDPVEMPGVGAYHVLRLGDRTVGGMAAPPFEDFSPLWIPYFEVADCDAAVARAVEVGGHVHQEPKSVAGAGRFAAVGDPNDASFCVIVSDEG